MKKEHHLVIKYFLLSYYKIIQSPMTLKVDSIFGEILSKQELILIIKDMYDQEIDKHYDLQNVSVDDLLEIIGDNSYILSYIIDNWNDFDTTATNQFTPQMVKQTLKELGVQRHVLSKKPIQERDSLDYKTYQTFLKESGKPYHRYGIVSKEIAHENIGVFADQIELYHTEAEARKALFNLQIEQNQDIANLRVVAI